MPDPKQTSLDDVIWDKPEGIDTSDVTWDKPAQGPPLPPTVKTVTPQPKETMRAELPSDYAGPTNFITGAIQGSRTAGAKLLQDAADAALGAQKFNEKFLGGTAKLTFAGAYGPNILAALAKKLAPTWQEELPPQTKQAKVGAFLASLPAQGAEMAPAMVAGAAGPEASALVFAAQAFTKTYGQTGDLDKAIDEAGKAAFTMAAFHQAGQIGTGAMAAESTLGKVAGGALRAGTTGSVMVGQLPGGAANPEAPAAFASGVMFSAVPEAARGIMGRMAPEAEKAPKATQKPFVAPRPPEVPTVAIAGQFSDLPVALGEAATRILEGRPLPKSLESLRAEAERIVSQDRDRWMEVAFMSPDEAAGLTGADRALWEGIHKEGAANESGAQGQGVTENGPGAPEGQPRAAEAGSGEVVPQLPERAPLPEAARPEVQVPAAAPPRLSKAGNPLIPELPTGNQRTPARTNHDISIDRATAGQMADQARASETRTELQVLAEQFKWVDPERVSSASPGQARDSLKQYVVDNPSLGAADRAKIEAALKRGGFGKYVDLPPWMEYARNLVKGGLSRVELVLREVAAGKDLTGAMQRDLEKIHRGIAFENLDHLQRELESMGRQGDATASELAQKVKDIVADQEPVDLSAIQKEAYDYIQKAQAEANRGDAWEDPEADVTWDETPAPWGTETNVFGAEQPKAPPTAPEKGTPTKATQPQMFGGEMFGPDGKPNLPPETPPELPSGPGAAKANQPTLPGTDFTPSPNVVGIANARLDAQLEALGRPPAKSMMSIADQTIWDQAIMRMDREPEWVDNLIHEFLTKPRPATPEEQMALLYRNVDISNETLKTERLLAEAKASGNIEAVDAANGQLGEMVRQLEQLAQANRNTGSEMGRAFRLRQMLADQDFTLDRMLVRKMADLGVDRLTQAEIDHVTKNYNEMKSAMDDLKIKFEKSEAANLKLATQNHIHEVIQETVREMAARRPEAKESDVTAFLKDKADAARERMAKRVQERSGKAGPKAQALIDPQVVADYAIMAAYHLSRGVDWAVELVKEFGDEVKPYLDAIREEVSTTLKNSKDIVRAGGRDVRAELDATLEALGEVAKERTLFGDVELDPKELKRYANAIARQVIALGERDPERVLNQVHSALNKVDPAITRRISDEILTGYGQFTLPSRNEVEVTLANIKSEQQLQLKLDDMRGGTAPKPTGYQRQPKSDRYRRLEKEVNEAKRRGGYVVTDKARQLKSALDAIHTRQRNEIADLRFEIATRQRIVRGRTSVEYDAEALANKAELEKLRAERDEIFGTKGLTDAQRLQLAIKAAERAEKFAQEKLARAKKGDFSKPAKKAGPTSKELEAIKAKTKALNAEIKSLYDLANPKKTPEEVRDAAYKASLAKREAMLIDKLARRDFSVNSPKPRVLDAETAAAKARVAALNERLAAERRRDQLAKLPFFRHKLSLFKEVINTSRSILSSYDLSATLRQGGFGMMAHPIIGLRAFAESLKAARSEANLYRTENWVRNHPLAGLAAESGLYIAPMEVAATLPTKMEEVFMSGGFAERHIPGVRASNRAFVADLNVLRMRTFEQLVKSFTGDTPTGKIVNALTGKKGGASPEELKAIANYINVTTGRGNLGSAAMAAETLATVFWSPRLVTSRFQTILGQPMWKGTARTRALIAGEYARMLTGMSVVYLLAHLSGAQIQTDPRSSDFGKLRWGTLRVDPLFGLSQSIVLLSRVISGQTMGANGKITTLRGDKKKFGAGVPDLLMRFTRSKLTPALGLAVNLASGESVVGEKVTPATAIRDTVVPLSSRDIYDVMRSQGVTKGTAIMMLSLLGYGVQDYEQKSQQPQRRSL